MGNQRGFTLIEMVMVILLLGILAAVAVPKFWDLGANADQAAADGGIGGIKSGVAIYNASMRLNGSTAYPANPINGNVVSDLYSKTTDTTSTTNCTDFGSTGQWSVNSSANTTAIYYRWKSASRYSTWSYTSATGAAGTRTDASCS